MVVAAVAFSNVARLAILIFVSLTFVTNVALADPRPNPGKLFGRKAASAGCTTVVSREFTPEIRALLKGVRPRCPTRVELPLVLVVHPDGYFVETPFVPGPRQLCSARAGKQVASMVGEEMGRAWVGACVLHWTDYVHAILNFQTALSAHIRASKGAFSVLAPWKPRTAEIRALKRTGNFISVSWSMSRYDWYNHPPTSIRVSVDGRTRAVRALMSRHFRRGSDRDARGRLTGLGLLMKFLDEPKWDRRSKRRPRKTQPAKQTAKPRASPPKHTGRVYDDSKACRSLRRFCRVASGRAERDACARLSTHPKAGTKAACVEILLELFPQ